MYEELVAVAKTANWDDKQPEGMNDTEYLKGMCVALGNVSDDNWQKLSNQAAKWYNAAVNAINGLQPPPPLEGYKGQEAEFIEASIPDAEKKTSKPQSVAVPPRAAKKAPAKAAEKKQAAPPVKQVQKASGVIDAIRRTIILHPDWATKEVHEYLVANGHPDCKADTVAVNAGDIRHVIRIARELGFWNDAKYTETKEQPASSSVA